jgi:hypothetical protein
VAQHLQHPVVPQPAQLVRPLGRGQEVVQLLLAGGRLAVAGDEPLRVLSRFLRGEWGGTAAEVAAAEALRLAAGVCGGGRRGDRRPGT